MNSALTTTSRRVIVLAPQGRDATIAANILQEGGLAADICSDLQRLVAEIGAGAGAAVLTDDALRAGTLNPLVEWIRSQPPWSDFPFVLLTRRGGGLERNPEATRQMQALGNVIFLERPFHPTTLLSVVGTALRGRLRQYDGRTRLEALRDSESNARAAEINVRRLNETLEARVQQRTAELAATNRQLVAQIEEREKVESTLRQMQRLEAIGQLTSGVAHDFNNLLTVVLGNIGFFEKSVAHDAKLKQRLSHMRLAAERGAKLTSQLLAFSRRQRLEPEPFDLNKAAANMHDLLQSTLGGGIAINTVFGKGLWPAMADPAQIELVVLNLVINARDAMQDHGTVTIETANAKVGAPERPEEPAAGEYVIISVTDTGSGMTKDVLAKAFEPFFTTKEIGKGSGLGLSQVLGFAKQSGGGMRIETRVGEGTSVKIYLPRAPDDSISQALNQSAGHSPVRQKSATIMVVDDDSTVRDVTASILADDLGYVVVQAGSGGAALDLLDRTPNVDLILMDVAMPGMSGVEVARQAQLKYPTIPILFVTGYIDKSILGGVSDDRIVKKPFLDEELLGKVSAALAHKNCEQQENVVRLRP